MFQFTLTSPAVTTVLLLSLVTPGTVTSREIFFKRFKPKYIAVSIGWSSVHASYSTQSVTECSLMAFSRDAMFFNYNQMSQRCDTYMPPIRLDVTQDNNIMAFYKADLWLKVFRIHGYTHAAIGNCFFNIGEQRRDRGVYRIQIIDTWARLPIDKVTVLFIFAGGNSFTLEFDGRNSDVENWFQYSRLIKSPWTDLNSTNHNTFSLQKDDADRSFSIGSFGDNCDEDRGWLVIIERPFNCSYSNLTHYPSILATRSNSQTFWNEGFEVVQYMDIHIHTIDI